MNDRRLAAALPVALHTRSVGVIADLFDAHGDRLFGYCWLILRNREIAKSALRDSLAAAQARTTGPVDPSWLYSLARDECRRRGPDPAAEADEPFARQDAGPGLIAWNTVMSLEPAELEALDLAYRHDVDLELVLGMPAGDVQALLGRARQSLERALGAEIVIRRGVPACPERAQVTEGCAGIVTPGLRERMLRHAESCPACGAALPRNVSPARVLAMLPSPALSARDRAEVLGLPGNQQEPDPRRPPIWAFLPRGRALLAGVAAVAITSACLLMGARGTPAPRPGAAGRHVIAAASPRAGWPASRRPGDRRAGAVPAAPRRFRTQGPFPGPASDKGQEMIATVTRPLPAGAQRAPAGPPSSPAVTPGSLAVTPGSLALGNGGAGRVSVTAVGGPIRWAAATSAASVTLSSYSGTLRPGQSTTLVVSVARAGAGGTAVITIAAGSSARAILVRWVAGSPSPVASAVPVPPVLRPPPVCLAPAVGVCLSWGGGP